MSNQTALLIMDMQRCIVDNFGGTPEQVSAVDVAHRAARAADIPVIYTVVQLAPGYADLHPRNRAFRPVREYGLLTAGDPNSEIAEEVAPLDGDIVVMKKRQSAFVGGPLDVTLRSLGATHLVLAGLTTSGVVMSTARHAADLDYGLTVLSDACADPDRQTHEMVMERMLTHQGDVVQVADWVSDLA